ncbi:MAG: hypothetical protein Q9159_000210 [Coniocarpon cinnabarinum]
MESATQPPFLPAHAASQPDSTALLHLRRDNLVPVRLQPTSSAAQEVTGYAEGHVTNTRFGSYPHSTLLDVSWGSQVRASVVDTGSRGQKKRHQQQQKSAAIADEPSPSPAEEQQQPTESPTSPRKRNAAEPPPLQPPAKKQQLDRPLPKQAATGFAHLLPLTPESWTISLPHRTQVVYTPDYSYVIQRLRIRPGSRVIEAGAGSGSFTHAAARAVYNGNQGEETGKIFSYEYHRPRVEVLRKEVEEHGLDGLVTVVERDVCKDGFLLPPGTSTQDKPSQTDHNAEYSPSPQNNTSPQATAIFLDLPTPQNVLPHLTSPQNPLKNETSHLCAFLPCIEQAQSFITSLRHHGFLEIHMTELLHRRLEVRRERVGLDLEGLRGVNAVARDVSESVEWLREVQRRDREFRERERDGEVKDGQGDESGRREGKDNGGRRVENGQREAAETRAARLNRIKEAQKDRKGWKEGRLVCRTEPEIKSHTSYLVFAVLPRMWSEEDERKAREKWSSRKVDGAGKRKQPDQGESQKTGMRGRGQQGRRQKDTEGDEDGRKMEEDGEGEDVGDSDGGVALDSSAI